ncbi:MAG: phosphoglyceromutase [Bacteroidota bacterium]
MNKIVTCLKKLSLSLLFVSAISNAFAQKGKTENLVIVTLDGCRWQDIFRGADSALVHGDKYMKDNAALLRKTYWDTDKDARRKKLMPFVWGEINTKGQLYGDRDNGSQVSVSNPYNLSAPGYSEIFTGQVDLSLNSNDQVLNQNTNVMEFLSKQTPFINKTASFGSWDRFPFILNRGRSKYPLNAGYELIEVKPSEVQKTLNAMTLLAPKTVSLSSRPDYITYFQAKEYVRLNHPKVFSLSLANTDDMAHAGNYGFYLDHIHAMDQYIADLWAQMQADPFYKGKTTMLITVDHGRGEGDQWTSHGPKVAHSNEIWYALIGPDTAPKGEVKTTEVVYQKQLAGMLAKMLGYNFKSEIVKP